MSKAWLIAMALSGGGVTFRKLVTVKESFVIGGCWNLKDEQEWNKES